MRATSCVESSVRVWSFSRAKIQIDQVTRVLIALAIVFPPHALATKKQKRSRRRTNVETTMMVVVRPPCSDGTSQLCTYFYSIILSLYIAADSNATMVFYECVITAKNTTRTFSVGGYYVADDWRIGRFVL